MSLYRSAAALLLVAGGLSAADAQLPGLRIEPSTESSILYVKDTAAQPLTAFLVELVGYPGSYYQLWEEDAGNPIASGVEKRIPIRDMTVGAVPDYVKITAAVYADGTTAGSSEKVQQLIERRKCTFQTTKDLIARIEKAQAAGTSKDALVNDLKQWAEPMPSLNKANRRSHDAIVQSAAKKLITETIAQLDTKSPAEVVKSLQSSEAALADSKPSM